MNDFRWIEDDKYSTKDDLSSGVLKGKILHIKLAMSDADTVSLYVTRWRSPFPCGLFAGAKVCVTNVVKKVSNQGRSYLKATLFTEIKLVEVPSTLTSAATLIGLAKLVTKGSGKFPTFKAVLTPLDVLRVSVKGVCKACQTPMGDDLRCPYVGCGYSTDCSVFAEECSATFNVQDDTYAATVYVNKTEVLRKLLEINSDDWSCLSADNDCLAYNCHENQDMSMFTIYCDNVYTKYMRFECTVRPLRNEKGLRLVCLDAIKL